MSFFKNFYHEVSRKLKTTMPHVHTSVLKNEGFTVSKGGAVIYTVLRDGTTFKHILPGVDCVADIYRIDRISAEAWEHADNVRRK